MELAIRITGTMTLGDLIVGLGTLALAGFTYWLGKSARAEGSQVAAQVQIERERLESADRPYVVPAPDRDWSWKGGDGVFATDVWRNLLPVKNVGPGAALNVQGSLNFGPPSGVHVRFIPTSLGPHEKEELRLHWDSPPYSDWKSVAGTFDYEDIHGGRWQTNFRLKEENDVRYVEVAPVVQMPDSTRPVADAPEDSGGWPASPSG
jgi:hypothetical protein